MLPSVITPRRRALLLSATFAATLLMLANVAATDGKPPEITPLPVTAEHLAMEHSGRVV